MPNIQIYNYYHTEQDHKMNERNERNRYIHFFIINRSNFPPFNIIFTVICDL